MDLIFILEIIGAIISTILWKYDMNMAMIVGAISVIVLRLLANHYQWSLPKA